MLRALGATVTGVEIGELRPEVAAARIGLTGSAGVKQVTVLLVEGLAVAITAGEPVGASPALVKTGPCWGAPR
jgi:hypothetical protein